MAIISLQEYLDRKNKLVEESSRMSWVLMEEIKSLPSMPGVISITEQSCVISMELLAKHKTFDASFYDRKQQIEAILSELDKKADIDEMLSTLKEMVIQAKTSQGQRLNPTTLDHLAKVLTKWNVSIKEIG